MRTSWLKSAPPIRLAAAAFMGVLLLAACGGTTASAPTSAKTLQIAYLSFAVANSYDAPMLAAAQATAAADNAKLTVFDANNSPDTQFAQLQDAITSAKFDGIVIQPIFGPGLETLVKDAVAKKIPSGVVDQILGPDLSTDKPQVNGLSANVVFVQTEIGRKQGELVVKACTGFGFSPCKVGYLFNIKVSSLDTAIRGAFDKVISPHSDIKVVAEGQAFFNVQGGLTATQDMLQAHRDLNVLVGADQGITGAMQAIKAAGLTGKIVLIGYGGSALALQNIASGAQYATVVQAPASEGRFAVDDLVKAIRMGTPSPSHDPVAELPDAGIATKDNVQKFTAEWPG